ncbi:MAG: methylmalonyl-CoA epimerase [Actinobacteria bacterium]|nr:methylmalonyl-CoA epimerase [Actinomycetota bacterium]
MLERIDHVGYAVADLEEAVRHHERLYGGRVVHREAIDSDGVAEALVAVGGSYIQLLAPTRPDSPVARFLDRHGPGVHHVGYGVADVAGALERLRAAGVRPLDERPRPGSRGRMVAFVHPRDALGVLVELVEDRPGPPR